MSGRTLALAASQSASAAEESSSVSARKTTKTISYKTDSAGNVSTEIHTHVDSSKDHAFDANRKYEERIRILEDDLSNEQHLRKRIEKEKHDFQLQIVALSERLTDSEGGNETQLDINRKRETEIAKLRKLLEDVHMESEQSIHDLRKKHQIAMMDLQEQMQSVSISKEKIVKEKSILQSEIAELIAKIEILSQEKTTIRKIVERLEIQVQEYNVKIEELNKVVVDVTSQRNSLQGGNTDAQRQIHEMKLAIETAIQDKSRFSHQVKDLQTKVESLERIRAAADSHVHGIEHQLKTLTDELHEEHHIRLELERQLAKLKEDGGEWRKRFETESRLHVEDIDDHKKKFSHHISDMNDKIDSLNLKLRNAEQHKVKLQQEIQIFIKDIEVSQVTIREVSSKLVDREKKCDELAARLREMTDLFERADHDNKAKVQDILKLSSDMDRLRLENEGLKRDYGKLSDEHRLSKSEVDALKRRLLELDNENRKLANEREELARAFKDSDVNRAQAEHRIQELETELRAVRSGADAAIRGRDEDAASTRKKLVVEIEQLTIRLQETELKLRSEVDKMKQKMTIIIHELEISLDSANKNNLLLQNNSKIQSAKITDLNAALDETTRKMNSALEQYSRMSEQITILEKEVSTLSISLSQAVNDKKASETKLIEVTSRLSEVTSINSSLSVKITNLEKELVTVSADCADITKDLKFAEERIAKISQESQHYEGLYRDEQVRVSKSENVRKSLETQVRSLTIRMEEIETTSISNTRRTIQKMESRIEELEILLENEKRVHLETSMNLQKREKSFKSLMIQTEEDRKNLLIYQESLHHLNEKIKMYKRQLDEQEVISNTNIMRVKKLQRELEASEDRANDAESSFNALRTRHRVFAAAAETHKESVSDEVERQVVVRKTVTNISSSNVGTSSSRYTALNRSRAASVQI